MISQVSSNHILLFIFTDHINILCMFFVAYYTSSVCLIIMFCVTNFENTNSDTKISPVKKQRKANLKDGRVGKAKKRSDDQTTGIL